MKIVIGLDQGAIEEIQQMNSNQLEGLVSFFELLMEVSNVYNIWGYCNSSNFYKSLYV